MINPETLLAALLATLQDIPELVTAIGGPANISAYVHNYPSVQNRLLAIQDMEPPQILLAWTGTTIENRSRGLSHRFCAYLKPTGSVAAVFMALRSGVVTTGGKKFYLTRVDNSCDFPDVQGCAERIEFLDEHSAIDFHEVPIVLTERGPDN